MNYNGIVPYSSIRFTVTLSTKVYIMGMFSWCCKGCGHELKEDEYVRMNGCKGVYDGYGRNTGGFDYHEADSEPACWHELCYQQATPELKLDETASRHARNQGFGHAALEFLRGYDPKAVYKYSIYIEIYYDNPDSFEQHRCYIVKQGNSYVLQNQDCYEKLYSDANANAEEWYLSLPKDISHEELERQSLAQQVMIEEKIGMQSPVRNSHVFESFDEALLVAHQLLPNGNCYLCIFGESAGIEGAVYVFERYKDNEKVTYQIGKKA